MVAYVVAHCVTGTPLPLASMSAAHTMVTAVATETDDPVDDVRVEFAGSQIALLQAKRTLRAGRAFSSAVAQWVVAARQGIDPSIHRLVIVAAEINGPMKVLARLLDKSRTGTPAALTDGEQRVAALLDAQLTELTDEQRKSVWASAAIWELRVEEPTHSDSARAISQLQHLVADHSPAHAARAWDVLLDAAGRAARLRTGYDLAGWLEVLRAASIPLHADDTAPAAAILRRQRARTVYLSQVTYDGTHVDLSALGATLPPLKLADTGEAIQVGVDPEDSRATGDLLWAFLRRRRVILTGLPGGGKSTVIRQVAAQLASDATMPFPVVASLRGINPDHPSDGILTQIVRAATKNVPHPHQAEIVDEIHERLTKDRPIALLLDSLDETYDRRHAVVGALRKMVAALPEGTAILLATRHVAYAQAATLGWHDLELLPPKNITETVRSVLTLAATEQGVDADAAEAWVMQREAWVARALHKDRVLEETPLLPTFLALLAARRESVSDLPSTRGRILVAMVKDFVLRHELSTRGGGRHDREETLQRGTRAFTKEADTILDSQGAVSTDELITAVAADLAEHWGDKPGPSRVNAAEAIRAFDEAGVFVFDHDTDRVTPRISLLAEVGAAMFAIDQPDTLADWVRQRTHATQLEPLTLACSLSTTVLGICESELERHPDNYALAAAMARASLDNAPLTDSQLRLVCTTLTRHICTATSDGWRHWNVLARLRVPTDLIETLLRSMDALPIEHQRIIRSDARLVLHYEGALTASLSDYRDLLRTKVLPKLDGEAKQKLSWMTRLRSGLIDPQVRAARALLRADPSAAVEIAERAREEGIMTGLRNRLRDVLNDLGYATEARSIDELTARRLSRLDFSGLNLDFNESTFTDFLGIFRAWEPTSLTTRQQIDTAELGTVLNVTRSDVLSNTSLLRTDQDYLLDLFRYTAMSLHMDCGVLASQASVVIDRVNTWGSLDPYLALRQEIDEHVEPDWAGIDDPDRAASIFDRTLGRTLDQAHFAAYMLSLGPKDIAGDRLQLAITRLGRAPRHQRLAAIALTIVTDGELTQEWLADKNPILREVAAQAPNAGHDTHLALLHDDDAKVRLAALRQLIDEDAEDLPSVLEEVAAQEPTGWMCRSCARTNDARADTCASVACHQSAPNPAAAAREELLVRRDQ
ncbi:ATP-binding protein [Microbacterium oxydans]|uniref:NACHT domain-containing protein n=1 Tax=Microbacterium sp. B19(2022) TaxID=2914045 RepID=UPI001431D66C|nr:ATP-binding protein [Microbacterium sp. B19(2022)]